MVVQRAGYRQAFFIEDTGCGEVTLVCFDPS